MEIDEALKRAKPLGRTQALLATTTCIAAAELSFVVLSTVFIAEIPSYHCVRVCNNCTLEDSVSSGECLEYVNPDWKNETQGCSNGWQYDTELYGKSIVSEWDLVCDKDSLPGLSQSILVAGAALGSVLAGAAADRFGRRPVTIASLLLSNVVGIAVSFSPNYATFVSLRFLWACIFRGAHLPSLISLFEFLIPKHRPIFGGLPAVSASVSLMVMAGIAYWVRDWRIFHAVLLVPSIATMGIIWFQPESVRWLSSEGKHKDAEKWIQKVAKFNGVKDFPNPALKHSLIESAKGTESGGASTDNEKGEGKEKMYPLFELFRPPTLLVTCVMSWLWLTHILIYFGFALTTGNLSGNFYLNFFLSSFVELPARILPMFIIKRVGSLVLVIFLMFSSGICMTAIVLINTLTDFAWMVKVLSFLGKFLIVSTLPPLNLLQTGLCPTKVRTAGMGLSSLVGSVGGIVSPLLIYLDKYFPSLSLIIMISSAFLSAFLCFFLPETKGTIHPDTREDLRTLMKTKRLLSCRCGKGNSEGSDISNGESPGVKSEDVSGMTEGRKMSHLKETVAVVHHKPSQGQTETRGNAFDGETGV